MLKTLLATSALTAVLALGAQAQTAPDPSPPAIGADQKAPAAQTAPAPEGTETAPIVPKTAEQGTEPAGEMGAAPGNEAAPVAPKTADQGTEPAGAAPGNELATEPTMQEGWTKVDVATISTDTLIGADIRSYDNQNIASVQDVLLGPDGKVDNVVARFGGFLGFGETTVLLTTNEITVVKDADDKLFVLTSLTPEALKDRPEYKADQG